MLGFASFGVTYIFDRFPDNLFVNKIQRFLVYDVMVGSDRTRDNGFAQPPVGFDYNLVGLPGHRVNREHHAGRLGVDHLLNADAD